MRDFSHSLPMALLRAREAVMSEFRPMLRRYGLTEQQWRVLRALYEVDSIEISVLAKRCFILSPSLSRILQGMEVRDLVLREPVKSDQRRVEIKITASGKHLVKQVAPETEQHYQEIALKLGAKNLDDLYKILGIVERISD